MALPLWVVLVALLTAAYPQAKQGAVDALETWDTETRTRWEELTARHPSGHEGQFLYHNLVDFLLAWQKRNSGEPAWEPFLRAAPEGRKDRLWIWEQFDRALGPGEDVGLAVLRDELMKLPTAELYFVAYLYAEYRIILADLGEGNVFKNCMELRQQCGSRAMRLQEAMSRYRKPFRENWTPVYLATKGGRHFAHCYVYDREGRRVEIVADAWTPLFTNGMHWWKDRDSEMFDGLLEDNAPAFRQTWCEPTRIRLIERRIGRRE